MAMCRVEKRPPAVKKVTRHKPAPKPTNTTRIVRVKWTRKQLAEACEKLGLILLREVRIRLADLLGKDKPVSRQTIYTMFNRRELVPGMCVANLATVTKASWEGYVSRWETANG